VVTYWHFDYSDQEVAALTNHLRDCARRGTIIHYDDAFTVVKELGNYHGPHDPRLWYLLGYISEQEIQAGRAPLSAIVVVKSGEGANRPGQGFFLLERDLGRYKSDDDSTWVAEIEALFEYWPQN
jgi:hypothetical protein